jgi:hypothetical protein
MMLETYLVSDILSIRLALVGLFEGAMKLLIRTGAVVAYYTLHSDVPSCVLPEMRLWKVPVKLKTLDGRIESAIDVVLECVINNLFRK